MMLEIIISVIAGMFLMALGICLGFLLSLNAFKRGAMVTDNVYHDRAPFDEELENEEPLDSHTDGQYLDEA